jgi:hypothetical protein
MATQKALLVQDIGKPLVLVHDRLIPKPGHGQIQIKVTVAGKPETCRLMMPPLMFGPELYALMLITCNRAESS